MKKIIAASLIGISLSICASDYDGRFSKWEAMSGIFAPRNVMTGTPKDSGINHIVRERFFLVWKDKSTKQMNALRAEMIPVIDAIRAFKPEDRSSALERNKQALIFKRNYPNAYAYLVECTKLQ